MSFISVKNLTYNKSKKDILKNINLEIEEGSFVSIIGANSSGKTTLLKQVANSILKNEPDMHMLILLIDERPEEVTDIKEAIEGPNVEVIYSTFDELPEHHKRVSEMVIERAKRLLRTTDKSVLDISLECGFNNVSQFNRQFKRITGLKPLEYKSNK